MLRITNLSKTFGAGSKALNEVSLTIRHREVHGLLGQNGSGKSTLIKVLAGFHEPDPGAKLEVAGRQIALPVPPGGFASLGIAFVHQHLGLIPTLSVVENFLLSDLAVEQRWKIDWPAEKARAKAIFEEHGLTIDPSAQVSNLSPVERALLAIIRAFDQLSSLSEKSGHPGILILDEPTPFLPRSDVERLFELVRRIVARGASVIFVSHDIDEVLEITDRATVLRDGKVAGTFSTRTASKADIVEMIVGRHVDLDKRPESSSAQGRPHIRIDDVTGGGVARFSLELRPGEVVGLTGLVGSGYDDVLALIYGAKPAFAGQIRIGERVLGAVRMRPRDVIRAGCIYIPSDRAAAGAVLTLSVIENLSLPVLNKVTRQWGISSARLEANADRLCAEFDVRPRNPRLNLGALSGGNQQKVVLAKWFQTKPSLILLDEPTQGVDIGAREQVFQAIRKATNGGASVLCGSSDYEQLTAICDRVLIFGRGKVVAELSGNQISKRSIAEQCYRANEHADSPQVAESERLSLSN